MKDAGATMLRRVSTRFFSGFFGATLVFVLSPVLLLLGGAFPELGEHANLEIAFSLLASLEASCCVAGLVSSAYRAADLPLLDHSPTLRLPALPEPAPGEELETRQEALPVVAPSLVLPTLISGLGGWVGFVTHAPRVAARPSAA